MGFVATVLVCAFLLLPVPGMAQEDSGEQLISQFLERVATIEGDFEQQLVDADNVVIETANGRLAIRRPGQFRWSYDEPYRQEIVADGLNIWSYDVDLEQVTVKSQKASLASTPALLLGGSSDVLEDFEYVGSFDDRGSTWVMLRPKNTENGFNKVELGFTDGELTRMLFGDNLGQTTLIALLGTRFNEPINESVFTFEAPDGVDLIGTPVSSELD